MRKCIGLLGLLVVLSVCAYAWEWHQWQATEHPADAVFQSNFLSPQNWGNQLTWIGLFGVLSLAQCLVIITGGIDVSIGSVCALIGVLAAMMLDKGAGWSPLLVIPLCLLLSGGLGLCHGVLITRLRIQPFVVTLCGLFIYRGLARFFAGDMTQGFGNAFQGLRWFGKGTLLDLTGDWTTPGTGLSTALGMISAPFLVMMTLAFALTLYLHYSAQGRHVFALGANEEAARYSGVSTLHLKAGMYVLCSLISGFGGLLLAFKVNSLGPAGFGNFYELYAIAGAVLGGCSLRGGTGTVPGVILGISLIVLLRNLVNILSIPSELEYVVIGGAILLGICVDELFTRRKA